MRSLAERPDLSRELRYIDLVVRGSSRHWRPGRSCYRWRYAPGRTQRAEGNSSLAAITAIAPPLPRPRPMRSP